MSDVVPGRYSAQIPEEGVVVFLIGMRINQLWRVWKWAPVFASMPRMIVELMRSKETGLLERPRTFVSGRVVCLVQYWRDFDSLAIYARSADHAHLPAWRMFNKRVRDNGTVGIWHETYRIAPGQAEAVYGNMPVFGLAAATTHVPASRVGQSAARRLGVTERDDAPVEPY
jgi:hypothetical protein